MKKTVLLVALLGGALFISGCKNNDGGGAPACQPGQTWNGSQCIGTFPGGYGYPNGANMCQAGQLQTQYGCLPGGCGGNPNMATYNGQCIAGTPGGINNGQFGNQYLGGMYPNGYPYGSYPYGSTYNQYPYGNYNNSGYYYYYYYYGF